MKPIKNWPEKKHPCGTYIRVRECEIHNDAIDLCETALADYLIIPKEGLEERIKNIIDSMVDVECDYSQGGKLLYVDEATKSILKALEGE